MRDQGPAWPAIRLAASASAIPLRSSSIPLVVGSPPYNVGITYPTGYKDWIPWALYTQRARKWAAEIARILQPGGRVFLNVQPTVPRVLARSGPGTHNPPEPERVDLAGIWADAFYDAGLKYRDVIVWTQDSYDGACQWGSWLQPSAPNLRGSWEAILIFYRDHWKREPKRVFKGWKADRDDLGGDWTDLTRNVWKIQPARVRKADPDYFPAQYPIEIPARAIRLSTWPNELVVDPFAGSGTTGLAAEKLGRRSVLLDLAHR